MAAPRLPERLPPLPRRAQLLDGRPSGRSRGSGGAAMAAGRGAGQERGVVVTAAPPRARAAMRATVVAARRQYRIQGQALAFAASMHRPDDPPLAVCRPCAYAYLRLEALSVAL